MWEVKQTRRFARQYKKLQDNTATDVDLAVEAVQHNPEIGERKKEIWRHCMSLSFAALASYIFLVTHERRIFG